MQELPTIVSGQKNVARLFFRRAQLSTSAERCRYISALVLTCFCLKKGRAKFFRPETVIASFLSFDGVIFQNVIKLLQDIAHCNVFKLSR